MHRNVLVSSIFFASVVAVPSLAHADDTPTSARAPAAPTAAAPKTEGPPDPVVELSADDGCATIERRLTSSSPTFPLLETGVVSMGTWQHQCIAPCELRLDPHYAYRVAGDGLVPTDSFAIPRDKEHVRVQARMGSSVGRVSGALGMVGGAMLFAGGALALAATPVLESEDVGSKGFRSAVLVGGVAGLSLGVVSAAVGALLWLSNGSSAHTESDVARSASR